jgi:hypothetical protein
MTTLTTTERAARLNGATTAWLNALRPAVRALSGLGHHTDPRPIRHGLDLAAEHVRIACVLLEAVAAASEPHIGSVTRELDEHCLTQRIRSAAL